MFRREAEGGVRCLPQDCLDIVYFSNVIKGICNRRCCFVVRTITYNAVNEPAAR